MKQVKKIQLRGISRSPSDRMTADGGIAESLNVQLEEQESAPALPPVPLEDMVENLPSLPNYMPVYIHKMADRKRYIYVLRNAPQSLWAFDGVSETPKLIYELADAEDTFITDTILAIGNTIVFSTQNERGFAIYKPETDTYDYLGSDAPILDVEVKQNLYNKRYHDNINVRYSNEAPRQLSLFKAIPGSWARWFEEKPAEFADDYNEIVRNFWAGIDKGLLQSTYFFYPVLVRFAIRLYDDSFIHHTVPVFLNTAGKRFMEAVLKYEETTINDVTTYRTWVSTSQEDPLRPAYMLFAKLNNAEEFSKWKDVIKSVDMFVSKPVLYPNRGSDIVAVAGDTTNLKLIFQDVPPTEAAPSIDEQESIRDTILEASRNMYLVRSFPVDNLSELANGVEVKNDTQYSYESNLVLKERLTNDYRSNHKIVSEKNFVINERLLSIGIREEFTRGMSQLLSLRPTNKVNTGSADVVNQKYSFLYEIHDNDGSIHFVRSWEDYKETKEYPWNPQGVRGWSDTPLTPQVYNADMSQVIFYPDSRCVAVYVIKEATSAIGRRRICKLEMKAHPYLAYSYYIGDISKTLSDLTYTSGSLPEEDRVGNSYHNNYFFQSKIDNPFYFPVEGRKRINANIISLATISTALSEGQFGQFNLYVFTDAGVWAMRANEEGSYINIDPTIVTRDALVDPHSLVCIDQAIVFVTERGVHMLTGSGVREVSTNMNGIHYVAERPAVDLMDAKFTAEDFTPLIKATLVDSTPFMAFMLEGTSIAYDYAGRRLIFFNEKEDYQYVYMLATETWHKIVSPVGDAKFYKVLNSFPDAVVAFSRKESIDIKGMVDRYIVQDNVMDADTNIVASRYWVAQPENEELGFTQAEVKTFLDGGLGLKVADRHAKSLIIYLLESLTNEFTYAHWDFKLTRNEEIIKTEIADVAELYDYSTFLSRVPGDTHVRSVIATRPFDLGEPDVYKTISEIKVRGNYEPYDEDGKKKVQYILLGSNDGHNFTMLHSLRGQSWKLYRLMIIASLNARERISWIEVEYETRFVNRLR